MKTFFFVILFSVVVYGCGKKDGGTNNSTVAGFSISGYETGAPAQITFINTSTNATSYSWVFGDGTFSTLSNPVHTYNRFGGYLLTLKATGPSGESTICKLMYLDTLASPAKSAFSYFFDKCNGYPVGASFKTTNPASINTAWDFGSGVVDVNRNPIRQFVTPGDYTIKYSSQINGVRDTIVRIIQIQ
ncbi:MAG: PKD domain-containing protein [Bacteroidota bacterium]